MSDLKFCPECGAKIIAGDRFCGDCGIDIQALAQPAADTSARASQPQPAPPPLVNKQPPAPPTQPTSPMPPAPQAAPATRQGVTQTPAAGNTASLGVKSGGNKNALVIMISLLALFFAAGGGLYWWLSRGDKPGPVISPPSVTQNNGSATSSDQETTPAPAVDLSRASTYLSEPGLKCTFFVNYPDGMSGVVERFSARVVSNEAVRVSEVETGVERGENFGYGFHYVERADGTYYILDQTPDEIFPVLKNNLTVGQTWSYQDEFGKTTWTVVDMGVDLNLGFAAFEDCLLVKEDNQAVGFQSISYYAPGRGIVKVIDAGGTTEYYKMTAITRIDAALAAQTVMKWSPNYALIKDDRAQY